MLLSGQTALITGAARGIGKAIALKFAAEGANIAFCDIVIDENALATKAELEALGVKVLAMQGDVSSFDSAAAIVKQTVETFGGIDILVNNAGITRDGLLIRMDEKAWDDVLRINLKSVYNYCHAAVPVMMKVRKGCIINVSSVAGLHGNAGQCNYSASKGAIVAFTRTLAKEIGPRNIRVNAIAPGFIITDMTAKMPEEVRKQWEASIPLRRGGTPEEIAKVCCFLASDLASYVSGQVITIDGGMIA
ncbi:MAG: 3-oxoacyl-[acyl-carrier-protein] reductase [Bacteroidales bacterium]|nr:3-oxoacyl-[acyl-carrier-protein] reductase [Bacteroidales bacterium]